MSSTADFSPEDAVRVSLRTRVLRWLRREVTIEPAIFIYAISGAIAYGSGVQTQLVLWKVCSVVKGYNDTVCDNLQAEEHDHVQTEVQIYKNNFSIKDQMLSSWPSIIYVFFAGALSDRFGRKWLICLPVLGVLVSTIFQIIHYIFIRYTYCTGLKISPKSSIGTPASPNCVISYC